MKLIGKNKGFYEHLAELRQLLLVGFLAYFIIFGICLYFASPIYMFLSNSMLNVLLKYDLDGTFVYLNITDIFFTYIHQSFYLALILFFLIFLPMIYFYLYDALKHREKKLVLFFIVLSPILFCMGILVGYYSSFFIWDFFIKFSLSNHNISFMPSVKEYLDILLNILLLFGFIFELPVLITLLFLFNIIEQQDILKFQKYAILLAFIIGAIFTPPDPISQIIVALLIMMLYYASYMFICFIKTLQKK